MQKFIHDNEQYVLEVKRKQGKTKIDKDINEYLRKKNGNHISLFNNNGNNSMNNNNNNNYNVQMLNNSLLAMNYLLLQNQLLLQQNQQNNQNMVNPIGNSIMQQNKEDANPGENENKVFNSDEKPNEIQKNEENDLEKKEEGNNQMENLEKTEKNEVNGDGNYANENFNQNKEIIKKILEAINVQNNNFININNNNNLNEEKAADPRKKGGK
jgi:hypothetical protein